MADLNTTYTTELVEPTQDRLIWGWFGQSDDSRRRLIETALASGKDLQWLFAALGNVGDSTNARITSPVTIISNTAGSALYSAPVAASKTYTFQGYFTADSPITADVALRVNAPVGSTGVVCVDGPGTTAADPGTTHTLAVALSTYPSSPVVRGAHGTGTLTTIRFEGQITTSVTAGTLQILGCQGASIATNTVFTFGRLTVAEVV